MKIAVGCDHRGRKIVEQVKSLLEQMGYEGVYYGLEGDSPIDYPDVAYKAAKDVSEGKADRAILVCGTGIGMSITANKIPGVRAALCFDELTAKISRQHNDSNVLCLSGDLLGNAVLRKMVETWLSTEFTGGRHLRRVKKIEAIEKGLDPQTVTQ